MKPARARLRATTPVSVLFLIATLMAVPLTLGLRGGGLVILPATINAAVSEGFTLSAPVAVSASAGVWLREGRIEIVPAVESGRMASLSRPASGKPSHIKISNAVISIAPSFLSELGRLDTGQQGPASANAEGQLAPLLDALAALSFDQLSVLDARVVSEASGAVVYEFGALSFTASRSVRSGLVVAGKFEREGVPATFEISAAVPPSRKVPARLPVHATVKSPMFMADLHGVLVTGARLQLTAERAALDIADLRAFAHWLGVEAGNGMGFKRLRINGTMDIAGAAIDIPSAELVLDGNSARGSVSVTLTSGRPSLEGTLAFDTLDLAAYLSREEKAKGGLLSAASAIAGLSAPADEPSLLTALDADFRISADRVVVAASPLGRAAASISLRDRRLNASLTDVELDDGGVGMVQLGLDLRESLPRLEVRGDFKGVDLGRLLTPVGANFPLKGRANISGDLSFVAGSGADASSSLDGRMELVAPSGVIIGIDAAALMASGKAQRPANTGWDALTGRSTSGQSLELRLTAARGVINTELAEMQTLANRYTAAGSVDLANRVMELTVHRWPTPAGQSEMGPYQIDAIRLRGPLFAPHFEEAPAGGRADAGRLLQQPPG